MQVINTPISPFVQNAPIAYCETTNESIFVDPGDEIEKLIAVQVELKLNRVRTNAISIVYLRHRNNSRKWRQKILWRKFILSY